MRDLGRRSADGRGNLEVGVNVSVDEVFGARSIHDLVEVVCERVVVDLDLDGSGNGSKG